MRAHLLEAAGVIASAEGVGAITLDRVARGAEVSKGGLLHHFPNRQALIEALCAAMFVKWDAEITRLMAADPVAEGRFTRAYVRSSTEYPGEVFDIRLVGALTMATSWDESLRRQWNAWLESHLAKGGGNENTMARRLARAAADGIWLTQYTGAGTLDGSARAAMITHILAATYEGERQ